MFCIADILGWVLNGCGCTVTENLREKAREHGSAFPRGVSFLITTKLQCHPCLQEPNVSVSPLIHCAFLSDACQGPKPTFIFHLTSKNECSSHAVATVKSVDLALTADGHCPYSKHMAAVSSHLWKSWTHTHL